MRTVTINRNDAGQRLDKLLVKLMPSLPKGLLYKSIRKNCVRVNGKHVKDGAYMLNIGDTLELYFKEEFFESKKTAVPSNFGELDIVYEDENIIVVNKPAGLVVHADEGSGDTLIDRIKGYLYKKGEYNPKAENSFAPALCSRLDRNTSGLITAAKNAPALRELNERIRNHEIRKFYRCIAEGEIPVKRGTLSGYLERGDKRVTVAHGMSENAKRVRLSYKVIKIKDGLSFVEIELLTGRTHQIRAQMADFGYPLLGDVKYGGHRVPGQMYQALACVRLTFDFKTDGGILEYLNGKTIEISDPEE